MLHTHVCFHILSTSFTSVSIFSCYSSVSISVVTSQLQGTVSGGWGRGALPPPLALLVAISGPKKSPFSGPTPSNGPDFRASKSLHYVHVNGPPPHLAVQSEFTSYLLGWEGGCLEINSDI